MPDGEDKAGHAPEDDAATETSVPSGEAGRMLGPYRLLQRLGEGGMGEVRLAQQTSPVRRDVAVKIIKRGLDTRQVVARFEAERQALALMDHPFIAKVFDAGETPEGRPYFVMEHVRGIPITEHCDRNRLSTRARLALFVQVCEAVQHAHQKAIIHRDLKPSNVLVSVSDGAAVAKIIDFGIAKATTVRLTEKTLVTELGTLIGTPEYVSPEQADLTAQDVDTRTDVYSLGVMLYEMLVGVRPFDMDALRGAGLAGMRKTICETEPPRPSTRLSSLAGEASAESARRRAVDVPTLRRQLTGDLDWITMKCLEKDRSRRMSSDTSRTNPFSPALPALRTGPGSLRGGTGPGWPSRRRWRSRSSRLPQRRSGKPAASHGSGIAPTSRRRRPSGWWNSSPRCSRRRTRARRGEARSPPGRSSTAAPGKWSRSSATSRRFGRS